MIDPINEQNNGDEFDERTDAPEKDTMLPEEGETEQPVEQPAEQSAEQAATVTDESAPTEPAPDEPQAEPTLIYRWDYAEQVAADTRTATRKRRSGVLTFAIVMSVCFVLTLLVLIASLAVGGFDRFVPTPPDTEDDGAPNDGMPDHRPNDEPTRPNTPPSDGGATSGDIPYGDGHLEISDGDADALTLQQISAAGNQVVVAISVKTPTGGGSGSGIIMTEDGYIATNHHVIANATSITVLMYDGAQYEATLIGSSKIDDLAVIKIDASGLSVATFGDSSDVLVGDRAVVIGHPAGLEFGWTSTFGYISAINRDVKIRDYDGTMTKRMTVLQTDAIVNSGNSGGPMFNSRGEVIGIITMKLAGNYEGMGFAIPSNGAVPLLEALMKTGTTEGVESEVAAARPVLGITGVTVEADHYYVVGTGRIYELTEEGAAETEGSFKAAASGVLITAVSEASDAHGKVREGDIVTAMNGIQMASIDIMREYLYNLRIGDEVEITYVRDGVPSTLTVALVAAEE